MKNSLFSLVSSFCFCMVSAGFAKEPTPSMIENLIRRPNHIYLGPDFASLRVNAQVRNFYADGHLSLSGIGIGYERLKPKSFYGALEVYAMNSSQNFSISTKKSRYELQGGSKFGSLQARFGYAFLKKKILITPYLGLGTYEISDWGHYGFKEALGSVSAGFKTQVELTSPLLIGLDGEIFRTLSIQQRVRVTEEKIVSHTNDWGCNLGLPITTRLGANWDIKITPSLTRLFSSRTMDIYATSVLLGYRF